jgi:mRNA degradation ribonuclease J1/J2
MKTYMKESLVSLSIAALILASGLLVNSSNAYAQNASIRSIAAQPAATTERRVFVRSTALLVRAAVVEEKLMKRPEFNQLGLAITRDESNADIILELRHDVLTKYVYSAVDTKTQTVVAGGKVSSLGGTVAGKVAKRFVKQLERGRP